MYHQTDVMLTEDMMIDDEQYASSDTQYSELDDTLKKPANWMTQDERDELGEEVDYNGSRLTQEQRQALLESYLVYARRDITGLVRYVLRYRKAPGPVYPGGTIFPWYLVKGLVRLRESANDKGNEAHENEYDSAAVKREGVINRWHKEHPDMVLADDVPSRYRTWPGELMQELDQIDRSAIRRGRQRYIGLLKEAEQKIHTLVAFYRNCGLIDGHGSPPPSYWQIPKIRLKRSTKPQYFQDKLDAINKKHGYVGDISWKLRTIETSRWLEATINGKSEPTGSNSPLPLPLWEKLETAWEERFHSDIDDSEDEMIAIFRQWRETMHARIIEKTDTSTSLLSSIMGLDLPIQRERGLEAPELRKEPQDSVLGTKFAPMTKDLRRQPSRRSERLGRTDQAVWSGRLRPRLEHQGYPTKNARPLHTRKAATESLLPKPTSITKYRKAPRAQQLPVARRPDATYTPEKLDLPIPYDEQPTQQDSPPQTSPDSASVTEGRIIRSRCSSSRNVKAPMTGVRDSRISKRSQSRKITTISSLTTKPKPGFRHLPTPSPSV
ncbi:MAG: hypothetical protein Q9188_006582 [Gyalolechia gomerana]